MNKNKVPMILRQYRITKADDKLVKEKSKAFGMGEAEYIRQLIRKGLITK